MPAELFRPGIQDLVRVLPEIVLTAFGTLVMVLEPLVDRARKRWLGWIALLGLGCSLWASAVAHAWPGEAFGGLLVVDGYTTFFRVLVLLVGMLAVLCALDYVERERPGAGEYYALILFSLVGQSLMAASVELMMVFIGLEISSLATYVLAGYLRADQRSNEAAIKYFLLGSFATAFLLYGVAWVYGTTGTTRLGAIERTLSDVQAAPPMVLPGLAAALMFTGLAFKVSAAPFQVWTPDVYQGAPAPVVAFLSVAPKAAAFAVLLRILGTAFRPLVDRWEPVLWMSALGTMLIGNFAGLVQEDIKRLLAYSSIAHAGYVLVAVTAHTQMAVAAALFYLAAYAAMNVGAFAIVTHFARQRERYTKIGDFAGLARTQPTLAALFALFLLSLIGVPLTAGFFGKFYAFKAAVDAGLVGLVVLALLNSAVAAYYYLRILVVMYFHEPVESALTAPPLSGGLKAAVWACALATLVLGIAPSAVLEAATHAATVTFAGTR